MSTCFSYCPTIFNYIHRRDARWPATSLGAQRLPVVTANSIRRTTAFLYPAGLAQALGTAAGSINAFGLVAVFGGLIDAIQSGILKVDPTNIYRFDQLIHAHQQLEQRRTVGATVLQV